MLDVLVRAGCFVAIIILGYVLRKINFFKEQDFTVLSKIVLRITLPAAIVTSFAGKKVEPAMLTLSLMGIGIGTIYIGLAFLLNRRRDKEDKVFDIVNLSGYNIGAFTMPLYRISWDQWELFRQVYLMWVMHLCVLVVRMVLELFLNRVVNYH